jgi:hypothetical protein
MSTLADFKAAMQPGTKIAVTNHYITREDHPSFGTTIRQVVKVNSASFYTSANPWPMPWPKASQIVQNPQDGSWDVLGGGAGQAPHELYLTIREVAND